jgi:hypothetical protein
VLARRVLPSAVVLAALLAWRGAPASAETLVMVSPPAELDQAVRASLAPWRVKIIVIEMASGTPAELALTLGAGFVVWRDHDQLVLWNAGGGAGERRGIPPDLDDAGAAALALSIKTWMNLGAPPPDPIAVEPPRDELLPTPPPPSPPRARIDAASGVRTNTADHGRTELRLGVAATARVWRLDAGLGVELGPAHAVQTGEGDGDLSMTVVGVHARWPVAVTPTLTVAPGAGAVIERLRFGGLDTMNRGFSSTDTAVGLDGLAVLEWRRGLFVLGLEVGASVVRGADLQDRNVKLHTPAHLQARGLARLGLILM